ncbi:MAG: O-antigen ligase family protein [Nitrospiria bacterium]
MSKTALFWLIAYTSGSVLALFNPVYGIYTYFLDYYAHPPLRWWGKGLPHLRWSFIAAIITLAAFFLHRRKLPPLTLKSHPQTRWLICLFLTALAVSPFSVWPEKNWESLLELGKLIVLYFLIINTVRTRTDFRILILLHILGGLYWGYDAFSNPHRVAGRLVNIGGPDTLNDNQTAAHLLILLPLAGVNLISGKWWEKAISILAIPFLINTFILCNSRGGFLALLGMSVMALIIAKGKARFHAALGIVAGAAIFFFLVDPQFISRQLSTLEYEADTSATGRLDSWIGALELIRDHPLGTGGGGFDYLSPIYIPEIVEAHREKGYRYRTVHNTYLLAGSEWGVLGLIFFLSFIGSTFKEQNRIRTALALDREGRRMQLESIALILGYVGVLTAGIFINRSYAESIYWLAAFTAILRNLHAEHFKKVNKRTVVSPENDGLTRMTSSYDVS